MAGDIIMCTALTLNVNDFYFGRTLDLDRSYGEEVCILPRNRTIEYRTMPEMPYHYAIIGMATVVGGTPLFYDASNEHGLSMAGLNFPGNAYYGDMQSGKDNIAPFEFIPWILSQCKSLDEARILLSRINIVNIPFSPELPNSTLHWIIADKAGSVVVESMADGLHIHEDPVGVMTNNPPFEYQIFNLNNYRTLDPANGKPSFGGEHDFEEYCAGLGALGMPGDVSSMSRFVRIAFAKANSVCEQNESSAVSQFFHLLSYVEMPRGVCITREGTLDITVYTSCMNASRGLYYYTTYDNRQISCVDMHKTDLDSNKISRFPLRVEQEIYMHSQSI